MNSTTSRRQRARIRSGGPRRWVSRAGTLAVAMLAACAATPAIASTAFGDLNNFDVYNDTGTECHGFEIELEDVHSTDVTYTYDWNHYGAPSITEDDTDPAHPRVRVRYAAKFNAATGSFSAYTAQPATAPSPTDGHQCTNPAVNMGCEHFGVGYYGTPSAVRYHWLVEDPAAPGSLMRGAMVNVATPTWTYYAPAPAQPAQVQAVVKLPEPPEVPVREFGDAVWVKSIVTTSHSNQVVELKDLVSDDPDDPADKNWTNGEPDEVEVEWHILQTEFSKPDGANNELAGGLEDLPDGDEVVTRRYEFYKYAGPHDPESYEASCDDYPQIVDPADPSYKAECDPASVTVLGDYIGSQMAGFNVEAVLGAIDHVQEGELDVLYTARTVVVGGNTPYVTTVTAGALPAGLTLDSATGVLSGTPSAAGQFAFTVLATDADAAQVVKDFTLKIVGPPGADDCPDDPDKTEPGVCGCGVADVDGNANGTMDCLEVGPQADLGITIRPSRKAVRAQKIAAYGLKVTSAGPDLAKGVVVTATLSGVSFDPRRLPKGCVTSAGAIACTFGDVKAGRKPSKRIAVTPTSTGLLTVTATVSSATLDPNAANQSASVTTVVE